MPLYFSLAYETDICNVIRSIDYELKTNLLDNIYSKKLNLFIDSFDEGNEI